jgi:two-component system, NarL family, response regulator LiaR
VTEGESNLVVDQQSKEKIRVVLADDHPLMRQALRLVLEKQGDFEIVAEAGDGEEAIRLVREHNPFLVIMDISMPKISGLEATRQIKASHPSIIILVLTIHNDNDQVLKILNAGANGYLLKTAYGDEIVTSIRALISGKTVLSPEVSRVVLKYAYQHSPEPVKVDISDKLSARDLEILRLSAKGISNKEIAEKLGLSLRTVKGYLADVFLKLNVGSRTEAVVVSLRKGIISLSDLE